MNEIENYNLIFNTFTIIANFSFDLIQFCKFLITEF